MTSKVTIIVGLPGSGKTHLAESLKRNDHTKNTVVFDDPAIIDIPECNAAVREGKNVIMTHPNFCRPADLLVATSTFESWGATVSVIYFENNPDACLANVERRNDGRKVRNYIRDLSLTYEVPKGTIRCRVWRPEDDMDDCDGANLIPDEDPYL